MNARDVSPFVLAWNKENMDNQAPSTHPIGKQVGKEKKGESETSTLLWSRGNRVGGDQRHSQGTNGLIKSKQNRGQVNRPATQSKAHGN